MTRPQLKAFAGALWSAAEKEIESFKRGGPKERLLEASIYNTLATAAMAAHDATLEEE